MKPLLILSLLLFFGINSAIPQSVAIGENLFQAHSSAILELQSSERGFLITRLTTTQRDAIQNPAEALMIYNTTTKCLEIFVQGWHSVWCDVDTGFVCGLSSVTFTYNGAEVTYGTVLGANDRCWLDRNLGASQVATSSSDSLAYGDFFQWGRPDDGHQTRFPLSGTTSTLSSSDIPGHSDFITSSSAANWDWRSPQNHTLWQGVNGINNPCPDGWYVPSLTDWEAEVQSWSSFDITGAFNSPLKMTMNGRRSLNDGTILVLDTEGFYWASTTQGTSSRGVTVSNALAGYVSMSRAYGAAIRCIKD